MTATRSTYHAHGCRACGARYMDACSERTEDARCGACAGGFAYQPLIDTWLPRPCCAAARLVTKQERAAYALAGRSNWHICPTCSRTHPRKIAPKEAA